MPQDYFDDGETPTAQSDAPAPADDSQSKSALVPKELCPGMKPGDMIELKIKRVLDNQYEVEYTGADENESEPTSETPAEAPMPQADQSLYE